MNSVRGALAVALIAMVAPVAVRAQVSTAADSAAQAAMRTLALPLLAGRWGVSEDRLVVEVGALRNDWQPGADAKAELLGSGLGGYWVLRVLRTGHADESVRLHAGVRTKVEVAARALPRGYTLSDKDVADVTKTRWGAPDGDGPSVRIGWVTRRMIRKGEELRSPAVQPALVVVAGRPVALVWRRDGVGLRVSGRAAGSAALGQDVYVRTRSGRRLRGVVVAPGVVDVTPGASRP